MAVKKKTAAKLPKDSPDGTTRVRLLRTVPATMLQTDGDTPNYTGPNAPQGDERDLPAEVAQRLIGKKLAEAV